MLTSRAGKCKGKDEGFTLLELVVVIFIISLTAALVFPSFYGIGEKKITSEAKQVASVLRYLNDSAIYTKQTYSLKFDFTDSALSWEGPDGEKKEKMKDLAGLTLPSRGEIKKGQVTVFFGPMGAQENIEVHFRDGDTAMTVTFSPVSGRAKVSEG